jgi:hypothetical protein
MPEASFIQLKIRSSSAVDPSDSFTTLSRKYRPIQLKSSGTTGVVQGIERGLEVTPVWLTSDVHTRALRPEDRILWDGIEYDIASIPKLPAAKRAVALNLIRR